MTKKYVCVSGGADSTALALLLWERGEDFEMVFADTGAELPEVYWLLPRLASTVNKPLHVVSNGSFYMHLQNNGFFLPSFRSKWCTRLLKQKPQDKFFESLKAEQVQVCVGIRADEPKRVRTTPRKNSEFIYPLVEAGLEKKDVIEICRKHSLLNPVYEWRSNVSCFCCFQQRTSDWKGLLERYPYLYLIAEEWERQSIKISPKGKGYAWRHGSTLEEMRKKWTGNV